MGRLIILKGKGGVSAGTFLPALVDLHDLLVINVDVDAASPRQDAFHEQYGERVRVVTVHEPDESVDVALRCAETEGADGVFTLSEPVLAHAAIIAEKLRKPHHPHEAVRRIQNKHLQRQALQAHGLPVPKFYKIESEDDLGEALAHIPLPAVFKPVFSGGSLLTFRIDTPEQLSSLYPGAREAYSGVSFTKGHEPFFLLEELLTGTNWHNDPRFGDYISVESLVYRGEIFHLAVTDHPPLAYPFRETGDLFPSSLGAEQQQQLFEVATGAIRAVGCTDGATHTEIKLTPAGPRVIEINGRLGGIHPWVFEGTTSYNILREVGQIALGVRPETRPDFQRYMLFQTMQSPAEDVRVAAISGLEQIKSLPGLRHVTVLSEEGTTPQWRLGDGTVLGLSAVADTVEELLQIFQTVQETVRFEYEPAGGPGGSEQTAAR